ncbi:MAG: ABC transporter permease subunit [Candidatus Devosia euplotis]|nr:ABC transporter permease subunit [Candidatus Devosia euplotis]
MQANEHSRNLFGTLYKIPLVVPGIVAGFLVMIVLDRGGMAERLLTPLGLPMPRLALDPLGLGAIIGSAWKTIPFMTLIIAGAMAAISKDVLAAARTLGAGQLTILWRIQPPPSRASPLRRFSARTCLPRASRKETGRWFSPWGRCSASWPLPCCSPITPLSARSGAARRGRMMAGQKSARGQGLVGLGLYGYLAVTLLFPLAIVALRAFYDPAVG